MKDVILLFPFNQSVKHIRVLCDHVQQLRVTGVGTEPAAVSSAVSVDLGKQPVFLTELVGVRLGHTVFGKQTDLRYSIQTSKAFWLILRNADIAHSVRRECGIVLADWRDFAVTIDCTHTSPYKTANLALVRSAGDDMMEHLIVGLVRMENGELDVYKRQALISFSSAVRRGVFGASSGMGAMVDLTSTVFTSIEVISSFSHATTSGSLSVAFSEVTSF